MTEDLAAQVVAAVERSAALQARAASAVAAASDRRRRAVPLVEVVESRRVIEQAKGMVMMRDRCDADRAFRLLVLTSQRSNVQTA